MNLTEEIIESSKSPTQLQEMQEMLQSIGSAALVFAIIAIFLLIVWFIRRKRKSIQAAVPKVYVQRTAFAGDVFGVVYDADEEDTDYVRYALICDGKGTELCRYEEADGQTIHGFSSENGTLYMHTSETYEDGSLLPAKWMWVPEHNELVECD
jgi:hypothetical protein